MKASGLPMAEFNTEGLFSVVFKRTFKVDDVKIEKTIKDKILKVITDNPSESMGFFAEVLGITKKSFEYQLYKLIEEGIIIHEGSRKSGRWVILK